MRPFGQNNQFSGEGKSGCPKHLRLHGAEAVHESMVPFLQICLEESSETHTDNSGSFSERPQSEVGKTPQFGGLLQH